MDFEMPRLNGLAQPFDQSRCSSRPYPTCSDSPVAATGSGMHNRRRVPIQKAPASWSIPALSARQPGTSRHLREGSSLAAPISRGTVHAEFVSIRVGSDGVR
jgi:hypothetical protein